MVFDVPVTGTLGEPGWVQAEGCELVVGHEDPSEAVVHLGNGVPESVALKVMGDSVSGSFVGGRAAKAAWGLRLDAKPGVGDPGVAPSAEDRETARGRHLGGNFARVLHALDEDWAWEGVGRRDEFVDAAEDVEREGVFIVVRFEEPLDVGLKRVAFVGMLGHGRIVGVGGGFESVNKGSGGPSWGVKVPVGRGLVAEGSTGAVLVPDVR